MNQAARYYQELDVVLRSLSERAFDRHWHRWSLPVPPGGWIGPARTIMMHKVRLIRRTFTDDEKNESRRWLREHGHSFQIKVHTRSDT